MNQVKFEKHKKAAFLDRDGVINEDIGYLHKIRDFKWIKGAIEALKVLKKNNFLIIIISNQSGVGRGFYTEKNVNQLHNWINKQLKEHELEIDDFFFSTELPTEKIENSRRKPSPSMINEAVKKYNLVKDKCFIIGDKESDLLAAKNASIKGFLFEGGNLLVRIEKILNVQDV